MKLRIRKRGDSEGYFLLLADTFWIQPIGVGVWWHHWEGSKMYSGAGAVARCHREGCLEDAVSADVFLSTRGDLSEGVGI